MAFTLNWGIIGCGKISHDFVSAVASLPAAEHKVLACGARTLSSAQEFATAHGIQKAYGSYLELVTDPEIHAVYIGAINSVHKELGKLALSHGKGVLLEKPLCVNVKEVKELVDFAKEKKVFLMEAIWSRFFPAYKKMMEEVKAGNIGEVLQVDAMIGSKLQHKDRCRLKEMGGGTVLDMGVYCVQFASLIFGGERPTKVVAGGHLNEDGVDESSSATLIYSGRRTATIVAHGAAALQNEAHVIGTNGIIKVPMRFWCPTEIETPSGPVKFELPSSSKKFNYANSVGLCYEAAEVRRCIQQGLTESPLMSLNESLVIAEIMEDIRKQVGVVYPQDA